MSNGVDELAGKDEDETGAEHGAEVADPGFRKLLDKLHLEHNFDLRQYKEASLLRRVRRRMNQIHVARFEDYMHRLDESREEYTQLLNVILINVTSFFRDPDAWGVIRERILPDLIQEAAAPRSLRFWSAGCSSGEEPYTLAMLVADCLGGSAAEYDIKIYGTDIDEDALTTARAGVYRLEALKDVPRDLFDKYFGFAEKLLASGLVWPALEHCLKCSHLFNILDSSGSIGVTERTAYILRVRQLAVKIARAYVDATTPAAMSEG